MNKKNIIRVSLDYDSTLSCSDVEKYAKELVERNFEVWIVTSRFSSENAPNKEWNDDLFQVADRVGIKRQHIHFTNYADKYEYLKDTDFIFHIDDDNIELSMIKDYTGVIPIYLFANKNWRKDCEKAINLR